MPPPRRPLPAGSPIGNPRLEFLPAHQEQIRAELRGMIERWKSAGRPLDTDIRHPFSEWAKTIGGILQVSGYQSFLANYHERKVADDPQRRALGLLGAARPDTWLRAGEWAQLVAELGLTKTLIAEADRESEPARARGMGVVLSAHREETFRGETEDERIETRLLRARRRFEGGEASTRYRFEILSREPLPTDDEAAGVEHSQIHERISM